MSEHEPRARRDGIRLQATLLHPADNVATALIDLPSGCALSLAAGGRSHDVVTREVIPAGHKVALGALSAGDPVRKYGEPIGCASQDIAAGAWVHGHNLVAGAARTPSGATLPDRDDRGGAGRTTAPRRSFDGYRRGDGRVGVRNHVLVLSPTGLTSAAARRIAGLVRGTVCVASGYGRGQVAADAKLHFDTLAGSPRIRTWRRW